MTAAARLGHDELRRFVQGVMETGDVHWDEDVAQASRYGALVAPPLYVLHAVRRPPGSPDPLDRLASDPHWDGLDPTVGMVGLPRLDLPLQRILNGGTEAEFFCLPKVGDLITAQARYVDIVDREGRSGPMVVATIESLYWAEEDRLLARVRTTLVMR
jgi:hypothetical protein